MNQCLLSPTFEIIFLLMTDKWLIKLKIVNNLLIFLYIFIVRKRKSLLLGYEPFCVLSLTCVICTLLSQPCFGLLETFLHFSATGIPFVCLLVVRTCVLTLFVVLVADKARFWPTISCGLANKICLSTIPFSEFPSVIIEIFSSGVVYRLPLCIQNSNFPLLFVFWQACELGMFGFNTLWLIWGGLNEKKESNDCLKK